jgi:hypothetical protein
MYRGIAFTAVLLLGLTMVGPSEMTAASPVLLTGKERGPVLKELAKSPAFAKATKGKKVVASTVVQYASTPAGAKEPQQMIEALHFRYDDGKTLRTTYNMSTKKVTKLEALEAYPTPLAAEEVAEAKKLAQKQDKKVNDLMMKYKGPELRVQALAPVISEKKHKLFGKRLARLVLTPKKQLKDSVSVTVNLTDKKVTGK